MATSSSHPRVILIGIAGPSCCGKTSYAAHLADRIHSPFYPIGLDDFFYRSVTINHPVLGQVKSEEEPETLNTSYLLALLQQIKYEPDKRTRYHRDNTFVNNSDHLYVVVEGFLLFALSDELTHMFDVKIFLEAVQADCRMKRYRREYRVNEKVPDHKLIIPNKFQQWFDYIVWDGYLSRHDLQVSKADKVFHFDEYRDKTYTRLDNYIDARLEDILRKQQ